MCSRRDTLLGAVLLLLLVGCSTDSTTGPVEVHWDREVCERCNMALGDRHSAAQVRLPEARTVQLFDDIGCALLWLDAEGHSDGAFELWVRDAAGKSWIDGRAGGFAAGRSTPMGYGFGVSEAPLAVDLDAAWRRVREVEGERRAHQRRSP